MTALVVPASLQNVQESNKIGIGVGVRMINRMPHASLRRKVDHCSKPMLRKQPRNQRTIREIHLDETESQMLARDSQERLLQGWVIIAVEISNPNHMAPIGQ